MLATVNDIIAFKDIIDTRAPAEFAEDHIPDAINLPVLSNTERAAVGKLHKDDVFSARRYGAGLIAANIGAYLRETLSERPVDWQPLVYCSRGGQRSSSMVEIMRRVGWAAHQLQGGYKAYRQGVIAGINEIAPCLPWRVIAGKTGVGKTRLLTTLATAGGRTLDLEALANHRGSVFGAVGAQPSQRRFETLLFSALQKLQQTDANTPIFVESESRKIGEVHLPGALLNAMRQAPALRLEADLAARVRHIIDMYQHACNDGDLFRQTCARLAAHTSAANIQRWQQLYDAADWETLVGELLTDFYDVGYQKSLQAHYTAAFQTPPIPFDPNDADILQAVTTQQLREEQQ